eukprot:g3676.t1
MSSKGVNSQGNAYTTPGGSNNGSSSYHYSNSNGSYYYKNDNGSTYYNSGSGYSRTDNQKACVAGVVAEFVEAKQSGAVPAAPKEEVALNAGACTDPNDPQCYY